MLAERQLPSSVRAPQWDADRIAFELRRLTKGEVRFDDASRALYATDASNYRQPPIGVVIPRDVEDVVKIVEICRRHGAPLLSRGGGTSLAGQCCNVAVVMDMSKYFNEIVFIDRDARRARVRPGLVLDHLRDALKKYQLTFGPDPATHTHCTLGGMIGNNSCGIHAMMAGRTSENIHELDVLTYDGLRMRVGPTSDLELERIIREGGRRGEIYAGLKRIRDRYANYIRKRYPDIPRRVSGYNLDALLPENGFNVAQALVGTEGTCVTILEADLRLVSNPPHRVLMLIGFPDVYEAADEIIAIRELKPIGLEGIDEQLVRNIHLKGEDSHLVRKYLPPGNGWLFIEFGGDSQKEAVDKARALTARLKMPSTSSDIRIYEQPDDQAHVWKIRESGLGSTARVPGEKDTWPGFEDSAVPPDKLSSYLKDLRGLYDKHGYKCALYGHFGQGCVHSRIDFDLKTNQGIAKYRQFMDEATDLVLRYGGSLSGEHGDGQARAEYLEKMFGPELIQAFREFKSVWDPEWKMNPGKVVDAYRIDENLRLGTSYNPPEVQTHFKFPDDKGSFPYATLRCVGVGKCRRTEGGTMCPSYMVTKEEKHSTRGRAHLLYEMFQGNIVKHGWRSEGVKDALDLCLSCKGCKSDCPVNVDMATYKAEFLSHYYKGRLRPRTAFTMGLIDVWARLASFAPELVNFFTQNEPFSSLAKWVAGIAPQRKIPAFAPFTFQSWFDQREPRNVGEPQVLLWPDTFNNFFHPETAIAAVEVLEATGYHVLVPSQHVCCGRPLYDFGMLDLAKGYLRRTIRSLRPLIQRGVPLVGLEPSCTAVFRDELKSLLPNDQDGVRLSNQTLTLSEFLEAYSPDFQWPAFEQKALVHGHCHHKAIMKLKAEESVFDKMRLRYQLLDSGCCGMAGSFGFEKEAGRYDVSVKAGERVLLPAVRKAEADTLIITDGFSCRTQIEQGTSRNTLHSAQVMRRALEAGTLIARHPKEEQEEHRMFDVAERYRQSLIDDRRERGEPVHALARTRWRVRGYSRRQSVKMTAAAAGVALATAGLLVYRATKEKAA